VTEKCDIVRVQLGAQSVYVVDTPGFEDTDRTPGEILEEISRFLAAQYAFGLQLRGIIYLHRIIDPKVQGSTLSNFLMFKEICGPDALGNVILLTTMWDVLNNETVGAKRQQELRDDFWADMIEHGSMVRKFDGSTAMAEALVCRLLNKPPVVLQIQRDVVDSKKRLQDTKAGQAILPRIESSLRETEKQIDSLTKDAERARKRGAFEEEQRIQQKLDLAAKERQKQAETRKRLGRVLGPDISQQVDDEKKQSRFRSRMAAFASFAGLTVTIAAHIILPLVGVPMA
jgi:macrodomain Ter protein organizer (MatP/YcbG family)